LRRAKQVKSELEPSFSVTATHDRGHKPIGAAMARPSC
jgi:hypothetical protein